MSEISITSGKSTGLSTLSILVMFPLVSIVLSFALTVHLLCFAGSAWRAIMVSYLAFIYIDRSPSRGGYLWAQSCGLTSVLRRGFWWRWAASYFPATCHRTAPLSAETPYLFACHPHGVFGVAIQSVFGTDSTGFGILFPGVKVHLLGLKPIFMIPFFREWVMLHGHATPGRNTIIGLLRNKDSVALAPGGAHESLDAFPGTMSLTIRKGFVRCAMEGGASLVPVLTFGENEIYVQRENREGSKLRFLQLQCKRIFGFTVLTQPPP